jgi:hypothetical protein
MKWISVNKQKPKPQTEVMVYAPNCKIIGSILVGMYFAPKKITKDKTYEESWTVYDFGDSRLDELVTHWMYLPDAP